MTEPQSSPALSPRRYALAARARGIGQRLGTPLLFGGLALVLFAPDLLPKGVLLGLVLLGVAALIGGWLLSLAPMTTTSAPHAIESPVHGRWSVVNSPASAVPSHGSNGYGQTYGFDLVFDPPGVQRPARHSLGFDAPGDFPAFGQPIRARGDGVVVGRRSSGRDHRCRTGWPAFAALYLEGFVREMFGARFVVGNSVVIDMGDGAFALCGHLMRGSVTVRRGDHVRAGDVIGRCGNSGNSSEPHLHLQVMDHPRPLYAAGLPVVLAAFVSADRPTGIPRTGEHLDAGEPLSSSTADPAFVAQHA